MIKNKDGTNENHAIKKSKISFICRHDENKLHGRKLQLGILKVEEYFV